MLKVILGIRSKGETTEEQEIICGEADLRQPIN